MSTRTIIQEAMLLLAVAYRKILVKRVFIFSKTKVKTTKTKVFASEKTVPSPESQKFLEFLLKFETLSIFRD